MVDQEDNMLAAYLEEYGANNWKQMVIIEEPFGRVEELWHYDMGLGYFGPRFRATLQGEVNPAVLADEVVNPPQDIQNQNEDIVGPMEVGDDQNGMDILAEAAALNDGIQNDVMNEGNLEVEENVENNNMEVVIGLAAVLGENAGELEGEMVQNE